MLQAFLWIIKDSKINFNILGFVETVLVYRVPLLASHFLRTNIITYIYIYLNLYIILQK